MRLDGELLYSDEQAITVTAASTNIVDEGVQRNSFPGDLTLLIAVTEAFATGTSLTIALQHDDAVGFGTVETLIQTKAIPLASLVAGARALIRIPVGLKRYHRVYYTVAGSDMTAGKITAGLVNDPSFQDGFDNLLEA